MKIALEKPASKYAFAPARVRYNGLFHVGDLFRSARSWFVRHKYLFVEKSCKHKHGSGGLEKEYEWRPRKTIYDFLKYEVKVIFKVKGIIDVEVVRDGQKELLQQGTVLIEISGKLSYDPFKRFAAPKGSSERKSRLIANLHSIYMNFLGKDDVGDWESDFEDELKDLRQHLIDFFEMESTIST